MAVITVDQAGGINVVAFLDMIATSEGTIGRGDDGYNVIVNPGGLCADYSGHPRKLVQVHPGLKSTAAGRYQFIYPTWAGLVQKLKLPDFTPLSQDLACIELLRQRHAYDNVVAGNFVQAVEFCSKEWASLPGAGYMQHENKIEALQMAYLNHGGILS